MPPKEKRSMRPALGLEKELVKDEISTALHTGVEKLEGKAAPKQRVDNFHNTKERYKTTGIGETMPRY